MKRTFIKISMNAVAPIWIWKFNEMRTIEKIVREQQNSRSRPIDRHSQRG